VPDYLFNKYINNTTCITKAKDFYDASLKKVQSYSKNPVSSVLTDFDMQTIDNKPFSLHEFPKEKVNLVVFYDPLCSHCITEIPKITQEISDLEKETQLKVGKIAVLNVFNKTFWEDFVKKNQLENWLNVTYKEGDTKTQEKLDVFSNPNYFILDKNGKILLKTYNLSFIKNYLTQ
jgi:alkyl hydroperoxide reductase subunit AhpC